MSDSNTQAEQVAELLRLVDQIANWSNENLREKNPARHGWLSMQLSALRRLAEETPEQSGAALLGAKVVWDMLYEDAWSGYGTRGGRKDKTKITDDEVLQAWAEVHEWDPKIGKTKAVDKITKMLNQPDRTCSTSTIWKRLEKLGI